MDCTSTMHTRKPDSATLKERKREATTTHAQSVHDRNRVPPLKKKSFKRNQACFPLAASDVVFVSSYIAKEMVPFHSPPKHITHHHRWTNRSAKLALAAAVAAAVFWSTHTNRISAQ